jgi:hypothetical protein
MSTSGGSQDPPVFIWALGKKKTGKTFALPAFMNTK